MDSPAEKTRLVRPADRASGHPAPEGKISSLETVSGNPRWRLVADEGDQPEPPDSGVLQPEIEGAAICRPHLFVNPEVAGLTESTTILQDSGPAGRWMLCLQWSDGRRQVLALPEWLEPAHHGQLWFAPLPNPPPPGVIPRWSHAGRQRWLDGETPNIAKLFLNLREQINRFVLFPEDYSAGALGTVILWVMLTYCYPAWPAVPYLWITGPLASGKSRLQGILFRLVWRPTLASSVTAGVLFRTLHEQGGTFLLDEAETLQHRLAQSSEVQTVLLDGYKAGGRVIRLKKQGDGFSPMYFDVYGPKALSGIGEVSPALASRCIRISMLRSAGDCPQVRSRLDADPGQWQKLRDDLHAFSLTHARTILQVAQAAEHASAGLSGRDAELWQPLLDLAGLCEGAGVEGLVAQIRRFAEQMIDDGQEESSPEPDVLLITVLAEFVARGQADVTPKSVLEQAQRQDAVTFTRWTPHRVASTLKRYGLLTHKTSGGRRSYHRTTPEQIRRVARLYGLNLIQENATFAPDATGP